ncbi:MAG: MFS transporter [Sphingomonadales bacterium]
MLESIRNLLFLRSNLALLIISDFIMRGFYQIGKTPLLPLFAASIGAGELIIGFIVSVSTMTGILLKPVFGILSDRWGRKVWLLVSTMLFSGMPFLYQFVTTEQELMVLRLFHGISTAIFGPVSLAYVAGINARGLGTRIAYFGMSRLIASLIAPLIAGILLTFLDFQTVFLLIGFCSLFGMVPIFLLSETQTEKHRKQVSIINHFFNSFKYSIKIPAIWLAGFLELMVYLTIYAVKAFLPLFIISHEGGTVLQAGLFFFMQELAHVLFRPVGGKLSDKYGQSLIIIFGMVLLSLGLYLLTNPTDNLFLLSAILFGIGQGLIFPSSVALLSKSARGNFLGAAMGFYGALRNFGKVIGPIIAGILLSVFSYAIVFNILAGIIILALLVFVLFWYKEKKDEKV